jgi:hypothetical protein
LKSGTSGKVKEDNVVTALYLIALLPLQGLTEDRLMEGGANICRGGMLPTTGEWKEAMKTLALNQGAKNGELFPIGAESA